MACENHEQTLADLDAAIASGEKSVSIRGRTVTFQNTEDMLRYADRLRRDCYRREGRPSTVRLTMGGTK